MSHAQRIARVVLAFQRETTGRQPSSVTVVLNRETLVITLHGTFTPAEAALAKNRDGAAKLRDLHRQLFTTACDPLRQAIARITGVAVREATAEVEATTGTVVQVFSLAQAVPADSWSGSDPGPEEPQTG